MEFDDIQFPVMKTTPNSEGGEDYSVSVQILLLMTSLTLLPALILSMTSFTRILIVFSILRQAIGLQQTPSNQILIGLTLFMTFFIMTPVFERVNENALQPYLNEEIKSSVALENAIDPFKRFMMAQTREDDIQLFMNISGKTGAVNKDDIPMAVLMPAFVTSELKTAFQIGFILFIPFLIIDLVVASVLMAMGMMMLSPLIVSLPFKIMLFVFVDGWTLIIGSLATSFRGI
ncbi:MAG: flagellar type III secretion system pore protein FliP [Pseudomonadota bacterium]|nr:flagellar type III secretion system pore protein FliP [Pseudomonadota bacterium]